MFFDNNRKGLFYNGTGEAIETNKTLVPKVAPLPPGLARQAMIQSWTLMDLIKNLKTYGNGKSIELSRLLPTTINWASTAALKGTINENSKMTFVLTPLTNAPKEARKKLCKKSTTGLSETKSGSTK